MELNKREIAWQQRKKVKKESHPTYARNQKYAETFQERLKKTNIPDAWSKEGIADREKFAKIHGRAWWVFDNYKQYTSLKQRPWIEDYMIKERLK